MMEEKNAEQILDSGKKLNELMASDELKDRIEMRLLEKKKSDWLYAAAAIAIIALNAIMLSGSNNTVDETETVDTNSYYQLGSESETYYD